MMPFFIKKKNKKKLVILAMVDGLGADLIRNLRKTKKTLNNSLFTNAWSNSDWTLPTFGNLITGKYTSNHQCYKPETYYNHYTQINYKYSKNIFEKFRENNFITGCYSGYVRINPTYKSNKGVDIFKYCKNLNASQVLEDVYGQIKIFENTSNFIFCHLFDTHGPLKNENYQISEQAHFDYKNYYFNQSDEIKSKGPKRLHDGHDEKKVISSLNYIDYQLSKFIKTINDEFIKTKKIDDYTIVVFGDHGTRTGNNISPKINNTNNRFINNISLMVFDKKLKKTKNDKLVETIDIFPSLADRYKINIKDLKKEIDGKNTIYSNFEKSFQISESIYDNYDLIVRNPNFSYEKNFEIYSNVVSDLNTDSLYDVHDNLINEKNVSFKKYINLKKKAEEHLKKNKFFNQFKTSNSKV